MKRLRSWVYWIVCANAFLWFTHCGPGDRVAGGSEIGNPVGIVVDAQGLARSGVALTLLPEDFNPLEDRGVKPIAATSQLNGSFKFQSVPFGRYVVTGFDPATATRFRSVRTVDRTRGKTSADTLRVTGKVTIQNTDTTLHGGSIYIPGTPFFARIDVVGRALLDSVPAGLIPLQYDPFSAASMPVKPPSYTPVMVPAGGETQANPVGSILQSHHAWTVAPGQDVQAFVDSLNPGDTLFLKGGIYALDHLTLAGKGRADAWIVLKNLRGETPILRGISGTNNLIEFMGAEYLDIQGLEIDSTLDGSDAIKFNEQAVSHHISLRNMHIHNIRGIAVNSQGDHHHIVIQGCHIHHIHSAPGTGIRIGDLTGAFTPNNWQIEKNWIHDCGYDNRDGFGISVLFGARSVIVRDNIVHDNGGMGIRIFGARGTVTPEEYTLVEGNGIWNSDEGIAAYSDVTVRNNVVFACSLMLHSYYYPGDSVSAAGNFPRNLRIVHNTFFSGRDLLLNDWDSTRNCLFANNAVYGLSVGFSLGGTGTLAGNISDSPRAGFSAGSALSDFRDGVNHDFYPLPGSALINKGLALYSVPEDFQNRRRDTLPDVGAFEFSGSAVRSSVLTKGFKP